jgi:transposase
MLERYLIEYCAPTLASMKIASLFCISSISQEELDLYITEYNEKFKEKGLRIILLKKDGRPLIYVYRIKQLEEYLSQKEIIQFMKKYGYDFQTIEEALEYLKKRILTSKSFPHEIGLFLGYPYGDVIGFIQNKGKNCKCCGHWKVYCNQHESMRLFEKYRKCKMVYQRLWNQGRSILKLTVAL